MPISREEAGRIAEAAAVARKIGFGVRHVYRLDEIPFRRPLLWNVDLEHCWIAYIERGNHDLRASTIVVLDEETGVVRYAGSANDEG